MKINKHGTNFAAFTSHLNEQGYTEAAKALLPNFVSPHSLTLPINLWEQAKAIIKDFYTYTSSKETKSSLLSCLDLHISPEGNLKVIEVNTNASMYLLALEIYRLNKHPKVSFFEEQLKKNFIQAVNLKPHQNIAIIDETPETQGLYFEFLMYKKWLTEKLQVNVTITDSSSISINENQAVYNNKILDAIYNRDCDFYFDNLPHLKALFENSRIPISPNPKSYDALANKQNLINWSKGPESPFQKALPKTFGMNEFDDAWSERKKFFLKPKNSFGSKAVYNGKSITRNKFESLEPSTYLMQERIDAPRLIIGEQTFKYDLRIYFLNDELMMPLARLYQGQLTNMRTPGGGVACVYFE